MLMSWLQLPQCLTHVIGRILDSIVCLTDRSQPDCRCQREPGPRGSQDDGHLRLRSPRELPQHGHRGQNVKHVKHLVTTSLYFIQEQAWPSTVYLLAVIAHCLPSYHPIQAELTFSAGDIINVFGDMDDDGFFYVSSSKIMPEHPM